MLKKEKKMVVSCGRYEVSVACVKTARDVSCALQTHTEKKKREIIAEKI
jgi:predicted urease superfamily metal-dependent hydrolase